MHSWSDKNDKETSHQQTSSHQRKTKAGFPEMLQFFIVTGLLAVVGTRVASLVVLEFCLRAISGWVTAGPVRNHLCNKNMPDTQLYFSDLLVALLLNFAELISQIYHAVMARGIYHNKQPIICFDSSISSVHMLFCSPGVQKISAAAVSSKPVLSGLCSERQFEFSPRGGVTVLAMPTSGSSTQLVPGSAGHTPAAPCHGSV